MSEYIVCSFSSKDATSVGLAAPDFIHRCVSIGLGWVRIFFKAGGEVVPFLSFNRCLVLFSPHFCVCIRHPGQNVTLYRELLQRYLAHIQIKSQKKTLFNCLKLKLSWIRSAMITKKIAECQSIFYAFFQILNFTFSTIINKRSYLTIWASPGDVMMTL